MTCFSAAIVGGLILLALGGHATAGFAVGASVAGIAAALHATYLVQRRAGRKMPDRFKARRTEGLVPRHRRVLDRWVLGQWIGIGALGAGGSLLLDAVGARPFEDVGLVYEVLPVGWVVLWSTVYVSSLIDWFIVLPKVSGVACPGPCERPGQQRWAGITGLWCFHRGVARLLVPAVLIGCPTVIGALTKAAGAPAICFSIATALALYLIDLEVEGKAALSYGLNPRRYVGDTVWLVHETEDAVSRRAAFLLDVSAEGGKFKYVEDSGRYLGKPFKEKHDDDGEAIALAALRERPRVPDTAAPCGDRCTGVNWYCWRNPLAHSQTSSAGDD